MRSRRDYRTREKGDFQWSPETGVRHCGAMALYGEMAAGWLIGNAYMPILRGGVLKGRDVRCQRSEIS